MKQGAENMIERSAGDKKQLADAQTMLADSRRKIDYIRMQQLRLRNMKSGVPDEDRNYSFYKFILLLILFNSHFSPANLGQLVPSWVLFYQVFEKRISGD